MLQIDFKKRERLGANGRVVCIFTEAMARERSGRNHFDMAESATKVKPSNLPCILELMDESS